MRKARIKKLTLENWRAQNRIIDFTDKTIIRGANGAGKSTITDAFFWLLTGFDAQNRSNYDLYNNTLDFSPENAIPAVVEGIFEIDGLEYKFRREAKQKWTRPRGQEDYVKAKSDDYTYYIDGLAVNAKMYNQRVVAVFADIDKLKLMLNVRYYQLLDWKELRKQFADMAGNVSAEELKGDYSKINPLIERYENDPMYKDHAAEAVKEMLRQQLLPLQKKLKSIESEIDGMKELMPDLGDIDEAKTEIAEKQARIEAIDKEIVGMGDANKPYIEKRNAELMAIAEKKREMEIARQEWDAKQNEPINELRKQLLDIQSENHKIGNANNSAKQRKASIERQIEAAKQQFEYFDKERDRLKAEKEEAQGRIFDENQACPTCGQSYPYEKIAMLKAEFYDKRDKDVAAIIERGKKVRAMRDEQTEIISKLEKELSGIEFKPLLDATSIEVEIEEARAMARHFDDTAFKTDIKSMEDNLTVVPDVNSTPLLDEKRRLNNEIRELQKIAAKEVVYESNKDKIAIKECDKHDMGVEVARLEGLIAKCVEREREWASIVRDRANKYLKYCKVEMTEISKSGELSDICTITIDGVDASVANTARQIIAGVDIANAFQQYAGIEIPLFIDNAEQICDCNLPTVENQLVLTYVDENYPKLMIL